MPMPKREPRTYYSYIMASKSGVLYIGITGDLMTRVLQHKSGNGGDFTSRYRVTRLLYFEEFSTPREAIARESELKGWRRSRKLEPIRSRNPRWIDLGAEWL
jgi:putative endonuclease